MTTVALFVLSRLCVVILDSRPVGEVLGEAQRLAKCWRVKEVIGYLSQDTSAYGVDVKHKA